MTDTITINFVISKDSEFAKELNKDKKLSEIRKLLQEKLLEDSLFTLPNGNEINEANEDDYNLSEVIKNDKIYIKNNYQIEKKQNKPIPGSKLIEEKDGLEIYLYPKTELTEEEKKIAKVFMLVGQTGSGKTTLLNSFLNYILGIKLEDNFRYKIIHEKMGISPTESQTSEVNVYNIKGINGFPPIQIIDTPGFGNTGGILKDNLIALKIKELFKEKVKSLNAICFVAQSSNARLTFGLKYIFTSILNLFGEDVKDNFIFLLTFCDGKKPKIVDALLENKDSGFGCVIPYIKNPWYFKFNNSAIFASDREDYFIKAFFKLCMKSFEEFTRKLIKLPRKSLDQTKQVLEGRNRLEESVETLSSKLRKGLDKIEYIKRIFKKDDAQLLMSAKNELINLNMECINIQDSIIKTFNNLQQIALNKTFFESSEELIESIEIEKCEKREGWQKRIEGLEFVKQQNKVLREIYKGENQNMNNMKKFVEDLLTNEKI